VSCTCSHLKRRQKGTDGDAIAPVPPGKTRECPSPSSVRMGIGRRPDVRVYRVTIFLKQQAPITVAISARRTARSAIPTTRAGRARRKTGRGRTAPHGCPPPSLTEQSERTDRTGEEAGWFRDSGESDVIDGETIVRGAGQLWITPAQPKVGP
jgi:hypothetical protein